MCKFMIQGEETEAFEGWSAEEIEAFASYVGGTAFELASLPYRNDPDEKYPMRIGVGDEEEDWTWMWNSSAFESARCMWGSEVDHWMSDAPSGSTPLFMWHDHYSGLSMMIFKLADGTIRDSEEQAMLNNQTNQGIYGEP